MKLTAVASAIKSAAERLGITLQAGSSPINLLVEVGNYLWVLRPTSRVSVSDGSEILEQFVIDFFKTKTDDANLADSIGKDVTKALTDNGQISDSVVLEFFRTLLDGVGIAESHYIHLSRAIDDQVTNIDDQTVIFAKKARGDDLAIGDDREWSLHKYLQDFPSALEELSKALSAQRADSYVVGDSSFRTLNKQVSSVVSLTDDVDGAASLLDDQEMQFFKNTTDVAGAADAIQILFAATRSFSDAAAVIDAKSIHAGKLFPDVLAASEIVVRSAGKVAVSQANFADATTFSVNRVIFLEPTLVSDTGLLRSQNYCDFTFFAEDFVGASRTFS